MAASLASWMMQLKRVPTFEEGNPYSPLPPDYPELSVAGQRLARLNACRYQKSPEDLVRSWAFFRAYYLAWERARFYKRLLPSPAFHYQVLHDVGTHQCSAVAAPRASAKSTVLGKELPMLMFLTRDRFHTLLVMPTQQSVTERFDIDFKQQFQWNARIIDDFGKVKPKHGQGAWSSHLMLNGLTGASMLGLPVKGRLLGQRPDLILPDDPENDPVLNQQTAELTEGFEKLLFDVLLPMLDDGGSAMYWIGTLLSKSCFLYYVLHTKDDKRFEYFNRRLLEAVDSEGNLLWEEKWDHDKLAEEEERMGKVAFAKNRLNRPGDTSEYLLQLDKDKTGYVVKNFDDDYANSAGDPLASQATLVSWVPKDSHNKYGYDEIRRPFGEAVAGMTRLMTMDYASCNSAVSDYVAMCVVGVESMTSKFHKDCWWVLDLFVGRIRGAQLYHTLFSLAARWRAQYIGIEAVSVQRQCVESACEYLPSFADKHGWTPRIFPITYPTGITKEDRIGSLEWRFAKSRVKYPFHKKFDWPWRELFHETRGFTGVKGCLQYDDALDSLAMIQFLTRGRRWRHRGENMEEKPRTLLERFRLGQKYVAGLPIATALSPSEIPEEVIRDQVMRQYDPADESNRRTGLWKNAHRRRFSKNFVKL